jgi:hypothetical protein
MPAFEVDVPLAGMPAVMIDYGGCAWIYALVTFVPLAGVVTGPIAIYFARRAARQQEQWRGQLPARQVRVSVVLTLIALAWQLLLLVALVVDSG